MLKLFIADSENDLIRHKLLFNKVKRQRVRHLAHNDARLGVFIWVLQTWPELMLLLSGV